MLEGQRVRGREENSLSLKEWQGVPPANAPDTPPSQANALLTLF